MKILELKIDNLKRLTAVEIQADGKPVVLTGDNGAGKSSVIEAIIWGLTGTGLEDPVRHGAAEGEANIVVGEPGAPVLRIKRKQTRKGEYLTVQDGEGRPVPSPQNFIDRLIGGHLALDPMEFLRMSPKAQAEALKVSLGIQHELVEIENQRKMVFDSRTNTNREVARLKASAGAKPTEDEALLEPIVIGDAMSQVYRLRMIAEKRNTVWGLSDRALADVERLENELLAAKNEQTRLMEIAQNFDRDHPDDEQHKIREIDEKMRTSDAHNAKVAEIKERTKLHALLQTYTETARIETQTIEECDEAKAKLLKEARMPYPGMELTDEGVMVKGERLDQQSTAEQIRISCAIATAAKPDLRILIVREGALLNGSNLAKIHKFAEGRGYQLWLEKFSESKQDGALHIVDGAIEK